MHIPKQYIQKKISQENKAKAKKNGKRVKETNKLWFVNRKKSSRGHFSKLGHTR